MAEDFLQWMAAGSENQDRYAIAPGFVTNNIDPLSEGKVEVDIPSYDLEGIFARLVAVGGGMGRGFLWVPQLRDEVLVAFNQDNPMDAYILGGIWSMIQRPPGIIPTDLLSKRVIKTGILPGFGHEIEMDDVTQSITIKTTTNDKITLGPGKIEIGTVIGLKLTLNLFDTPPSISIEATAGNIELKAPFGKISLNALQVEINGDLNTEIKSTGLCAIKGKLVKIS